MIRSNPPLIPRPTRRKTGEPVVAMINVVFLLLIFFLMTAQIAPPDPFDITLPSAAGGSDATTLPLSLSADGQVAYGDLRGAPALAAAAATTPLRLQADAALEAAMLARTLADLRDLGARNITLVTIRASR